MNLDGLEITKRRNSYRVTHTQSGLHIGWWWERKWLAEEYAYRLSLLPIDWTHDADANYFERWRAQTQAIERTLVEQSTKAGPSRNGAYGRVVKRKDEFYANN